MSSSPTAAAPPPAHSSTAATSPRSSQHDSFQSLTDSFVDVPSTNSVTDGNDRRGSNHASNSYEIQSRIGTVTITEELEQQQHPAGVDDNVTIPLVLRPRPSVTWDEAVLNNEGLNRRSSKRCCIFHKKREFGESSTDSSSEEEDDEGGEERRKIARPKQKTVPDFQRYHA
mmetsp:Transcript_39990/g.48747  ORF Transcript_39990/g.48747 Transcript_39990/m.48747 type:complete len:171 (-) Transcript_39990:108-620(-)|eukprot:CAMPEP_0172505324 /NCGR_PEP_ID=MMETSP1066-20121228/185494_1 /TAXON_ID=671091 /ORGANISM="Coscinodiscus wailesii, Strain CCMP2513" /LENGTH=170 /DNA_ID=CAMNT_0013281889 /DNA_START=40 /DNA_END=552 /DNA_ORIENTATION=-